MFLFLTLLKVKCCFSEANSESELDVKTILDYDGLGHALSSAGTVQYYMLDILLYYICTPPGIYILYVSD